MGMARAFSRVDATQMPAYQTSAQSRLRRAAYGSNLGNLIRLLMRFDAFAPSNALTFTAGQVGAAIIIFSISALILILMLIMLDGIRSAFYLSCRDVFIYHMSSLTARADGDQMPHTTFSRHITGRFKEIRRRYQYFRQIN